MASLSDERRQREQEAGCVAALRDAEREEERDADAGVDEELQARRPLDQREMAPGVLEDHRLVDHRQLEVRRRVVDRDARVLGERHHGERDAGEGEARIDRELALRERLDRGRERGRLADERGGEEHHQQRRLGEEADHHLAPRAERAERGADVHRGERDARPARARGCRPARSRRPPARRGGRCRASARSPPPCTSRRRARTARRGRAGDAPCATIASLAKSLPQHEVRAQHARAALVLQPRAALVHPAEEERREQHREHELGELRDGAGPGEAHRAPVTARGTAAPAAWRSCT